MILHNKDIAKLAKNYVELKKAVTLCMQKNFKQVCHSCRSYARCSLYTKYVDAWAKLEWATR